MRRAVATAILLGSQGVATACPTIYVDGEPTTAELCADYGARHGSGLRVDLSPLEFAFLSALELERGVFRGGNFTISFPDDYAPEPVEPRGDHEAPRWVSLSGEAHLYDEYCVPRSVPLIDVKLDVVAHETSPMYAEIRQRRIDIETPPTQILSPIIHGSLKFRLREPVTAGRYELSVVLVDAAGNRSEPMTKTFRSPGYPDPDTEYGGGFEPPPRSRPQRKAPPSPVLGAGILGGSLLCIAALLLFKSED